MPTQARSVFGRAMPRFAPVHPLAIRGRILLSPGAAKTAEEIIKLWEELKHYETEAVSWARRGRT